MRSYRVAPLLDRRSCIHTDLLPYSALRAMSCPGFLYVPRPQHRTPPADRLRSVLMTQLLSDCLSAGEPLGLPTAQNENHGSSCRF